MPSRFVPCCPVIVFPAVVLGPRDVPVMTDPEEAAAWPELAAVITERVRANLVRMWQSVPRLARRRPEANLQMRVNHQIVGQAHSERAKQFRGWRVGQ
jgi:hypothetical protein